MLKFLKRTFFEPRIAFGIFVVFIIIYLILLDVEGAFSENFLKFGPDKNTKFLGMKMDTWTKVILVYVVSFFSSILTSYYGTVMWDFIHSKVWNPAYKEKIGISKLWTTIIVVIDPLLYWVLTIIDFFITLTMRLQFLIPQFIGTSLIDIPYALMKINENKFECSKSKKKSKRKSK